MVFRNEAEFQQEFDEAFDPETIEAVIEALSTSYRTAQDLHDPARGSNNSTFGIGVYHYSIFELQKVADASEKRIVTSSVSNTFRLHKGKFDIACHKVGDNENEDILRSFPQNYKPKPEPVIDPNQLAIEFLEDLEAQATAEDQNVSSDLVLAHMGNPELGLCAVYLCRPRYISDDEIEWDRTYLLWKRSEGIVSPLRSTYTVPQDEQSPKPQVQRKRKPTAEKPQDETSPKPQVRRKKKETGNG